MNEDPLLAAVQRGDPRCPDGRALARLGALVRADRPRSVDLCARVRAALPADDHALAGLDPWGKTPPPPLWARRGRASAPRARRLAAIWSALSGPGPRWHLPLWLCLALLAVLAVVLLLFGALQRAAPPAP
ncbi:MAG: hypothetical protein RMM29_08360 [Planctomycetota bacterium]|nr:hypothetical protein [Planctomycetota bacterium]MDW8373639.1 hypothetical protein [Planctomycetota bacterium]